jgi:hypothetical protein
MKRTGVLDLVFYEGVPDLKWFLDEMLVPGRTVGCWRVKPNGSGDCLGMGLINKREIMGRYSKAEIGFAFLPGRTTIHEKVKLGRGMIQYVFDEYGFDSLFGTTPVENKAAVAYSRRLGFKIHGPVPDFCIWKGELSGVYISQMSR